MAKAKPTRSGRAAQDLAGRTFRRLFVIRRASVASKAKGTKLRWLCRCSCGNLKIVGHYTLLSGDAPSCGCIHRRHGGSKTAEHRIWQGIIYRCNNPSCRAFRHYGGRGIGVCDRWQGESGFVNFLADMGPRPSARHSLDRIDNDGAYEPDNCRWATKTEQMRNMRSNHRIAYNGQEKCLAAWAEETGIPLGVLWSRVKAGWPVEKALAQPLRRDSRRRS